LNQPEIPYSSGNLSSSTVTSIGLSVTYLSISSDTIGVLINSVILILGIGEKSLTNFLAAFALPM